MNKIRYLCIAMPGLLWAAVAQVHAQTYDLILRGAAMPSFENQ
jgi:hypothetical protein